MSKFATAQDIANRAAVEVGLSTTTDLFSSTDQSFIQFRNLLVSCGQELVNEFDWEILRREWTFTVASGDSGQYDLPAGWSHMIPQTGWDRLNHVPLGGPISPQDWQYLLGRNFASFTIYAAFRLMENKMNLYPQPPPVGLQVALEYISRYWVLAVDGVTYKDAPTANDDTILYPDVMMVKMLKAAFLGSRGFSNAAAKEEFNRQFELNTGTDNSSPIINLSRRQRYRYSYPYLDARYNTPDTNYGS